jgi:hypothetical protein
MREWAPRFSLMFMPLLALMLTIMYAWHRRIYVYDHVITALHFQTFVYSLLTLLLLVGCVPAHRSRLASSRIGITLGRLVPSPPAPGHVRNRPVHGGLSYLHIADPGHNRPVSAGARAGYPQFSPHVTLIASPTEANKPHPASFDDRTVTAR